MLESAEVSEPFYLYQNHPKKVVFPISLNHTATKRRSLTHRIIRKARPAEDPRPNIADYSVRKRPAIDLVETERYRHGLM